MKVLIEKLIQGEVVATYEGEHNTSMVGLKDAFRAFFPPSFTDGQLEGILDSVESANVETDCVSSRFSVKVGDSLVKVELKP